MNRSIHFLVAGALAASSVAFTSGCSDSPKPSTEAKVESLSMDSETAVKRMQATDPGLKEFLDKSYGYAIFPSVGKGGLGIGGAYGRGEVYKGGVHTGYADVTAISAGLLAGGQNISELLVFATEQAYNNFTKGEYSLGGNASVVALKAGAAAASQARDGVVVFVESRGGLMGDLSLEGQKFRFAPKTASADGTAVSNDVSQQAADRSESTELRQEQAEERKDLEQHQQQERQNLEQKQQGEQQELQDNASKLE